jgi:hypothetical protein
MSGGWEREYGRSAKERHDEGKAKRQDLFKPEPSEKLAKKNQNVVVSRSISLHKQLSHAGARPPPSVAPFSSSARNAQVSVLARDLGTNYTRMQSTVYRLPREGLAPIATTIQSVPLLSSADIRIYSRVAPANRPPCPIFAADDVWAYQLLEEALVL